MRGSGFYEGTRVGRIYALVDPRTGETRYVGKTLRTIEQRLYVHIKDARFHAANPKPRRPLHRRSWIMSLLSQGLTPAVELLEEGKFAYDELNAREEHWISQFENLTNAVWASGNGGPNAAAAEAARRPWSDERKQKQSEATAAWHAERRANGALWGAKTKEGSRLIAEAGKRRWVKLTPEERSAAVSSNWTDEAVEKLKATLADKKEARSAQQKAYWADPDVRARHRAVMAIKKAKRSNGDAAFQDQ